MKSRLLSGKVKKLTGTRLDGTRYEYLSLGQAEPDLGTPAVDGSVLIGFSTGTRVWSNVLTLNTLTAQGLVINSLVVSTSTTTGALIVKGGVGIGGDLNVGGKITARTLSITTTSFINNAQILTTATVNDFVTVIPNQIYQNTSSVRVLDNPLLGVEPQILITAAANDSVVFYSTLTEFLNTPTVFWNNLKNDQDIAGNSVQVYGGLAAEQLYISGTAFINKAQILTTQSGLTSELGQSIISQVLNITTQTNSTSTTTGALIIRGGAGIAKDVYIGGTLVFENAGRIITNQIEVKSTGTNTATNTGILAINGGIVNITTTTVSTSSTTGALRVGGGVGIGGNLNVGGTVGITGNLNVTSTATFGSIGGIVNIISSAQSTSSTTGALRVSGGVGIGGDLNVAGSITANQLTIQYTTVTTTIVETDDIIVTFNATNSTGTTTGALIVSGGVGVGADMYVGGKIYSQTAEVLTTASVNQYANQTTITAGTDTEVSTSTGNIVIWNTSTLQSITNRGNTTTNKIIISNSETRALYVEGGVYIGGDLELKGSLVVTTASINAYVTPTVITAGTDTEVSTSTGNITIWNTSTLQSVTDRGNTTTNNIIISNTSSKALYVEGGVYIGGDLELKGNLVLTTSNITAYVTPTVITAGTDTEVSTSTGNITIWNTSTLQSVTDRGNSTTNIIRILNTSDAITTNTGALIIDGGLYVAKDTRIDGSLYLKGSIVLTSATLNAYVATTVINAGTDTAVSSAVSTGSSVFYIWNTSTLQSVTDRGNSTTNTIIINNITESVDTVSGALIVSGGVGIGQDVNIGGNLHATEIYDSNNRVVTSVDIQGDEYIGVIGSAGTGPAVSFQLTNLGVQTLTAGTDTAVSTSTGTVVLWNTSNLQSVTDRGNSTTNAILLQNITSATSTNTGALVVDGGVGIGQDLYVGGHVYIKNTSYIGSGTIITSKDLEVVVTTASYITNNPALVSVAGTSTTYGTYNFGSVSDIWTFNDYDTGANTGFYSINDGSSSPAYVVYIGFNNIVEFTRVALNINYTQNSGHTVTVDLHNYQNNSWDSLTSYSGSPGWYQLALGVINTTPYINNGEVVVRLYHSSFGNTAHRTWIDYAVLEKTVIGGQGPRGATGATGPQGTQGLTTTTTSTFLFSNTTNSTGTNSGAVVVNGGVGIGKDVYIGGDVRIVSTTNSTATTNGALSIYGGIGIVKDLWVGGVIYAAGQAVVTTGTVDQALNQTLQSITDKGFTTTNRINILDPTETTSTDTGALTVAGGVGIGGGLYVGGRIYADNAQVITASTIPQFAATQIVAGTDTAVSSSTGAITIWNTGTLQSITNRGNTTTNIIKIYNTLSSTATVSQNAFYVQGGVGIQGSLLVQGKAVFKDDVLFVGSSTFVYSTNTFYTDNLISLHTPGTGLNTAWTVNDGKDIGFLFHYYDTFNGDTNAALILSADERALEWYSSGAAESGDTIASTATYGVFKTGKIKLTSTEQTVSTNTGALQVVGGVGIGGDLYVGGNIIGVATTASTFFGTAQAAYNLSGGKPGQIPYQQSTGTTKFDDYLIWNEQSSTLQIGTPNSSVGSIAVNKDVSINGILSVRNIQALSTQSGITVQTSGVYNTVTNTSTYRWSFNNDGSTQFPYYQFPANDGPYGYALVTNGTGTVSWSPVLSYVGSIGYTGSSSGFTGSTGYWGSQGDIGYTGSIGYSGSMGVGYTGSTSGFVGSIGYTGSYGYTGSAGAGYTGSTSGYIGSTGYTGSAGAGFAGSMGYAGYVGSQGFTGFIGSRGVDGTSVRILGSVATYTSLPGWQYSYGGAVGDGYIVQDTGHLWVWNGTTWVDAGNITGPQGNIGFSGSSGAGFTGSVGTLGYTGSIGYQGSKGALDPWIKVVANYTAANNQRLIADTSAGQFTVALPDNPVIGYYLVITDGSDWKTTPLLVTAGANTIEGYGDTLVVDITGITVEFIWSGSTWQVTATLGIRGSPGYVGSSGQFASIGFTGSQASIQSLASNIIPVTSSTYNLGAVGYGWNSVYSNFGYVGSNLYVGTETVDSLTVAKTLVITTSSIQFGGNTMNINGQGVLLLNGGQVGISSSQATALAAAMSVVMGM